MDREKDKSDITERSENQQDQVNNPKSIEDESKNKSNWVKVGVLLLALVEIVRDTFLEYKENDPRHTIYIRAFLIALFVLLEIISNSDFLGFRHSVKVIKKDVRHLLASIGRLILVCLFILAFLPSPGMKENINRIIGMVGFTQTPTPTAIVESPKQTETTDTDISKVAVLTTATPDPSDTPAPKPTDTPTPSPTNAAEPTPTSTLYQYKIGVFAQNPANCTKKDKNGKTTLNLDRSEEIKTGLIELGFNVTIIPYDQSDFSEIDVLYMPYGWSCTYKYYEINSIWKFLNQDGTGLLIGDPRPTRGEDITLDLFDFEIYFSFLTDESISEQGASEFSRDSVEELYKDILPPDWSDDFPIAETNLTIEESDLKYYYYVLKQSKKWRPSFVASSEETPRFVIMPGSELSVSKNNAVSKEIMTNIILWLAHGPKDLLLH